MSASQGVPLPVRVTARTIKLNTVISRSPGALDRGPSGLIEVPAFICGRAYKEIYSWIALVWVSSKVCCLGNFNKCSKEKKSWLQDRRAVCTSVTLGNDHHLRHLGTVCRGGGGETKANIVSPTMRADVFCFFSRGNSRRMPAGYSRLHKPRMGNNISTWTNDRKLHFIIKLRTPIKQPASNKGLDQTEDFNKRRGRLIEKIMYCRLQIPGRSGHRLPRQRGDTSCNFW